jgi:endogenous inhibitor of DNA gyrase (YacG/DUF329 family)
MDDSAPAPARRCPICSKLEQPRHRPFCSARCRQVDLGRWFSETYRVETNEPPDEATGGSED